MRITLKDIRDYMVAKMAHYTPTDIDDEYYHYDDDGHCGDGMWLEIQEYWSDFKSDEDFISLVTGNWPDELDLDGGRSYLLSDEKLVDMLFDYLYGTLGWDEDKYLNSIFNTIDLTDEISDRYENKDVLRDIKINTIIK